MEATYKLSSDIEHDHIFGYPSTELFYANSQQEQPISSSPHKSAQIIK